MEINTQQMEALMHLQEQQAQLSRRKAPEGFEALLTSQMAGDVTKAQASGDPALTGAALYSQIMLDKTGSAEPLSPDAAVFEAAFEQASGALDMWDSYTRTLGASPRDTALRDAYALLEGIDQQVNELKTSGLHGRDDAFDSIVNELAILSATEKFKFNRGDYLM